jgi:hypothetical protein
VSTFSHALATWEAFWFRPVDAGTFGLWRIGLLLIPALRRLAGPDASPPLTQGFVDLPAVVAWLPAWALTGEAMNRALTVGSVATGLACLGLLTRPSLVLLAVCNMYVAAFMNAKGLIVHQSDVYALVLVVLALCPGVDAYSVDRLVSRLWRKSAAPRAATVPAWPAQLVLVLLVAGYFTAGLSKLRHGGLAWVDGKTLSFYLEGMQAPPGAGAVYTADPAAGPGDRWKEGVGLETFVYLTQGSKNETTALAHFIAASGPLCLLTSVISVAWELGFVLLLAFPRIRWAYFVVGCGFHMVIHLTMQSVNFALMPLLYVLLLMTWGETSPNPLATWKRELDGGGRAMLGAVGRGWAVGIMVVSYLALSAHRHGLISAWDVEAIITLVGFATVTVAFAVIAARRARRAAASGPAVAVRPKAPARPGG